VWDDGSFDAEDDAGTGSAGNCGKAGGTWIELGQGGGWSPDPASYNNGLALSGLVGQIQEGNVGSITSLGADGMLYQTGYNGIGQATYTNTPYGGLTVYGNATGVPTSASAADWVEFGGCCITPTQGVVSPSGQAAAVAISNQFKNLPCVSSVTVRATLGPGKVSVGGQYNTSSGFKVAGSVQMFQVPYGGISPISGSLRTNGAGLPTATLRVGVPPLGLTVGTQGSGISSLGLSGRLGVLNYSVSGRMTNQAQCQ
jgi:hypothetical protein